MVDGGLAAALVVIINCWWTVVKFKMVVT